MIQVIFSRQRLVTGCLSRPPQKRIIVKRVVNHGLLILSLFLTLFLAPVKSSYAGQNLNLYDAAIPVTNESRAVRRRAFASGLEEVFIRLSGDSIIASKLKLPTPRSYVKRYSYQPITQSEVTAEGKVINFLLTVQYNGTRIVNYLRKNGFPIWSEHRADLVIWVAVRDGRTEYVLKKTESSLIKTAIDKVLKRRGVPPRWPAYDDRDSKILSFSDIRGGFREPLEKASARYAKGPVLSVSLSWDGHVWQAEWTLLSKKSEYRWSNENEDYNKLIQQALGQVVDTMGQMYAIHELKSGQEAEPVYLDVSGINAVTKYKYVHDYLASMSAVKTLQIARIDGNTVEFKLDLRSDTDAFLMLLKNDAKLIAVDNKPDVLSPTGSSTEAVPIKKVPPNIASSITKTTSPVQTETDLKPAMTEGKRSPGAVTASNSTEITNHAVEKGRKKLIYYFRL